jgi:hypothetical protein
MHQRGDVGRIGVAETNETLRAVPPIYRCPKYPSTDSGFAKLAYLQVQPEMERGRSSLVSNSTLRARFSRYRYHDQAIPQRGFIPAEPAAVELTIACRVHLGSSPTTAAKSSRGYRTTIQDREFWPDCRCRGGQTTCVKCGRRSARHHAYAPPKGLTRRVSFRRGCVAYQSCAWIWRPPFAEAASTATSVPTYKTIDCSRLLGSTHCFGISP